MKRMACAVIVLLAVAIVAALGADEEKKAKGVSRN